METSLLPRGSVAAEGAPLPRGAAPRTQIAQPKKKQRGDDIDEVLFGKGDRDKIRKRPGSIKSTTDSKRSKQDEAKFERESTQRKTPSLLTFSKLVVGMRVYGCVKAVNAEKVTLSLPNNLTATMTWSEASDEHFAAFEAGLASPSPLPDMLPIGTFLPCIVTAVSSNTDGKNDKMLRISSRASLLNKMGSLDPNFGSVGSCIFGSVKSLEDRGVIVNFGVKSVTGFLPFNAISGGKKTVSFVGQPIEAMVVTRPSKAVANLKSLDPNIICNEETGSFSTLQPGMMVEAKFVRGDLLDGGCLFSLWQAGFTATADWIHCGGEEMIGLTEKGDKKLCRIIWIDPSTKGVGLSLLSHLTKQVAVEWSKSVGEMFSEAVIIKSQPKLGLQLSIVDVGTAFAHISKIVDGTEPPQSAALRKEFPIGKKIPCRVLELNLFDGLYVVSLQPSVLSAAVTSYESLTAGMKVSGKVVKVDAAFGVLLELGQNIRGIVTTIHLSDSAGSETAPESRYKVGQMCKGRILSVENERVSITLKKSLVTTSLPIIASYEDANIGKVSQGFITKVDDFGIIVTFFGGVHGIVPAHTLGAQPAENPSEYFRVSLLSPFLTMQIRTASQDNNISHSIL
jgi:rRNA biogenesis protein RRP5